MPVRVATFAEEYRPPSGLKTFYVRTRSTWRYQKQVTVSGLSDEELAWVERVIVAEREARSVPRRAWAS